LRDATLNPKTRVGDRLLPLELREPADRQEARSGTPHRRHGDFDEWRRHRVTISRPFSIGVHEVTNEQDERFDPTHRERRGEMGFSRADDEAVVFVSWTDAVEFGRWLSRKAATPRCGPGARPCV
jgi:formylglycine-generating enzyme required for sulfatase activity